MTKPKSVAKTITSVLDDPTLATIRDRSTDISKTIEDVQSMWSFDMFSRKPGAAYLSDGTFVGTDLDLAVVLYTLADRGAVVQIPEYKSTRQTTVREGQMLSSKENRHGKLAQVISNKETFNFSVRINDMNVMTSDSVGDYRSFLITKFDGDWNPHWTSLKFLPNAEENKFIAESGILSGNKIHFKNFVHPNRWTSMYGKSYLITKALISRIEEESSYYGKLIKKMKAEGVEYPEESAPKVWEKTTAVGEKKSIKVKAFEAYVDIPDNNSEFPTYESTVDNLVRLTQLRKHYIFNVLPKLRFMTRATECAFSQHIREKGLNNFPSWFTNTKWEENYVETGKRTKWNRLVLFQPAVGQRAVAIRFREWEKSEQVSIDYEG